jgi:hypothetical protein
MAPLDRLRRRELPADIGPASGYGTGERSAEEALRARLADDPNDIEAFDQLADLVRRHAAEGHEEGQPTGLTQQEADDAVWALAEEIAQSQRAWYPLIELARLSIDDDREVSLRRLATAAERDHSGTALAQGLAMLRQAGHADDALGLGVGHWRPRDQDPEAGRQLIEAAIDAGRLSEARRHLDALSTHPDTGLVEKLRGELEKRIARAERGGAGPRHDPRRHVPSHHLPVGVVDVREDGVTTRLRNLLRL